jgi:hypothetical protein
MCANRQTSTAFQSHLAPALIKALTYVGLFVRASALCVGVSLHVPPTIRIDSLIVNSVFQSLRGWCRQRNISKFNTYNECDESLHSKEQGNCVLITVDLRKLRKIQQCSSSGKIGRKEAGPQVRTLLTNLNLLNILALGSSGTIDLCICKTAV